MNPLCKTLSGPIIAERAPGNAEHVRARHAYCRVGAREQGKSGLGIDARRAASRGSRRRRRLISSPSSPTSTREVLILLIVTDS